VHCYYGKQYKNNYTKRDASPKARSSSEKENYLSLCYAKVHNHVRKSQSLHMNRTEAIGEVILLFV
jgi:hypothetical protein